MPGLDFQGANQFGVCGGWGLEELLLQPGLDLRSLPHKTQAACPRDQADALAGEQVGPLSGMSRAPKSLPGGCAIPAFLHQRAGPVGDQS